MKIKILLRSHKLWLTFADFYRNLFCLPKFLSLKSAEDLLFKVSPNELPGSPSWWSERNPSVVKLADTRRTSTVCFFKRLTQILETQLPNKRKKRHFRNCRELDELRSWCLVFFWVAFCFRFWNMETFAKTSRLATPVRWYPGSQAKNLAFSGVKSAAALPPVGKVRVGFRRGLSKKNGGQALSGEQPNKNNKPSQDKTIQDEAESVQTIDSTWPRRKPPHLDKDLLIKISFWLESSLFNPTPSFFWSGRGRVSSGLLDERCTPVPRPEKSTSKMSRSTGGLNLSWSKLAILLVTCLEWWVYFTLSFYLYDWPRFMVT